MKNTIEIVIKKIDEYNNLLGTKYKLISNEYSNCEDKNLILLDENNYKYKVNYIAILKNIKRKSKLYIVDKGNAFTIDNIKQFIINNNISLELLSNNYETAKHKLSLFCDKHGEIEMSWDDLSHQKRCNKCFGNFSPTIFEINQLISNYSNKIGKAFTWIDGDYVNARTKSLILQDSDGCLYNISYFNLHTNYKANSLLKAFHKTNKFTIDNIHMYLINNCVGYTLVSDEYTDIYNNLIFKCEKHGLFNATWNNFYNHETRCPQCNESKGENKIHEWLKTHKIYSEPQKTFNNLIGLGYGLLSYDFYLPEFNLLIEYQGEFHDGTVSDKAQSYSKFKKQQEHDKRKKEYALNNGYNLLEIWYWDFNNIEDILDNELNNFILKIK